MKDSTDTPLLVACPICGTEKPWDARNRYRPFCSERCKLTDLGQWAAGHYRVAGEAITQEATGMATGRD